MYPEINPAQALEDVAKVKNLGELLAAWRTTPESWPRGIDPHLSEHYHSLVELLPQLDSMLGDLIGLAQNDTASRYELNSIYIQHRKHLLAFINIRFK